VSAATARQKEQLLADWKLSVDPLERKKAEHRDEQLFASELLQTKQKFAQLEASDSQSS
jgi:hypothetical protein